MEKENIHGPQHFDLNTGAKIPSIGLGTWKASPGVVGDAVVAAVKVCFLCFLRLNFLVSFYEGWTWAPNTTQTLIRQHH